MLRRIVALLECGDETRRHCGISQRKYGCRWDLCRVYAGFVVRVAWI